MSDLREQLIAALEKIGYPPVRLVGEGGASGHFRHDNEAFADALIAGVPALQEIGQLREALRQFHDRYVGVDPAPDELP